MVLNQPQSALFIIHISVCTLLRQKTPTSPAPKSDSPVVPTPQPQHYGFTLLSSVRLGHGSLSFLHHTQDAWAWGNCNRFRRGMTHGLGGSSGTPLPALSKALANPQNCKKIKKQKKRKSQEWDSWCLAFKRYCLTRTVASSRQCVNIPLLAC